MTASELFESIRQSSAEYHALVDKLTQHYKTTETTLRSYGCRKAVSVASKNFELWWVYDYRAKRYRLVVRMPHRAYPIFEAPAGIKVEAGFVMPELYRLAMSHRMRN